MNKKIYFLVVAFLMAGVFVAPGVYAEGVESWLQGDTKQESQPAVTTAAKGASPAVAQEAKTAATKAIARPSASGGAHSLDEIIYKISRAQANLEGYGSDLNGHGTKAIEYLKQALEELKQAK